MTQVKTPVQNQAENRSELELGAAPAGALSDSQFDHLEAYLSAQGLRLDSRRIFRFAGGLANINYRIGIDGKPTVLRMPPAGTLPAGANDMVREHRVMNALRQELPFVPSSLHLCEDKSVLGVPFQLIEFREGVIVRGDSLGPFEARPYVGRKLSEMLVETLARIHAVDPQKIGLGDFGKPEGFVQRAIEGWAKRAASAAETEDLRALVTEIADWLRAQKTLPRKPTLLHCDFKLDNCILDAETLTPTAVIDWDMGTRGDPLFDLATMLSYWTEPGDPLCMQELGQMPTARPGFASREEVVRRYADLSGARVDDFVVFRVLTMFKLGAVFLQLHQGWKRGVIGDDRYRGFGRLGTDLLEFTRSIAQARVG